MAENSEDPGIPKSPHTEPALSWWRRFKRRVIGGTGIAVVSLIIAVPPVIDSSWNVADRIWSSSPKRTPSPVSASGAPLAPLSASPVSGSAYPKSPEASSGPRTEATSSGCAPSSGKGYVQPAPARVGELTFCSVLINKGQLPIVGDSYTLEGQVRGPLEKRREVVLFVHVDPQTCDANGKRGAPGWFLIPEVKFDTADGHWFHRDKYGDYPEGITFGRTFEFATASPEVVRNIMSHREDWNQDGLDEQMLRKIVSPLAKFEVPPGHTPGSRPCT